MRNFRTVFVFLTALGSFIPPAESTTITKVGLPELARRSPTIVHGTVVSTQSHWTDDHTLIVTDVRVRVHTVVRGDPAREIILTQLGGEVGKLRVDVDGAAPLVVGNEAVLFLHEDARGQLAVTGLSQGRFPVVENRTRGTKTVHGITSEDLAALGLAQKPSPGGGAATKARRGVSIDEFLNGIKGLLPVKDAGGR